MKTRRPNRLPFSQIYSSNNCFFVTVCVEGRDCVFWDVGAGFIRPLRLIENQPTTGSINASPTSIKLSPLGKIVEQTWSGLPDYFENILLDEFVIMPNHFHGIVTFLDTPVRKSNGENVGLSEIIRTFKAKSTKLIKDNVGAGFIRPLGLIENQSTTGSINASPTKEYHNFQWQKSFYDHVIRSEKDLDRIREYIHTNPLKWELDVLNPANEKMFKLL
jgi:REP element-mobilizing transposase RayT